MSNTCLMVSAIHKIVIQDCIEDWPCHHMVQVSRDDKDSIVSYKLKSDELFHLCCRLGYPVPEHISNGFTNWLSEFAVIHIRVLQFRGRKKITICQGLPEGVVYSKILRAMQKNFDCGGAVVDHKEYGRVVQLQGNHALVMKNLLSVAGICDESNIYIHGDVN